jgi:predicted metal-dependent hydrolase
MKKIADLIFAQAIALNNLDFLTKQINLMFENATKVLKTVNDDIANNFKQTSENIILREMKNDFKQLENKIQKRFDENKTIRYIDKDRRLAPCSLYRKKSFVQNIKGKMMEFLSYMNHVYAILTKIKVRFPQFEIEKYKRNLKSISINTINEFNKQLV